MNLDEIIQFAQEGKAILFTGSGFSYGAKNAAGEPIKTGEQLKTHISSECGIPVDNNYTLSTIADHFSSLKSEDALINLLKRQFSVSKIANHHEVILSMPWKRIYTANYDDIIETAASRNGIELSSVTLSDRLDDYPKDKVCVHLNGFIKNLNRNTINNEFKLTDRSYDSETLRGKPWFDFMEKDFASAKVIVIIGFSMQNDIDIKRLIAVPAISRKVIFIAKNGLDAIEKTVLTKYANVEEIGVKGFADKLEKAKKYFFPEISEMSYTSFLHEHMTPLLPQKIEYSDIVKFYYYGQSNDGFFSQDGFGKYLYLINRSATDIFFHNLNNKKIFLAVSSLGNGKTVFCNIIRNDLRKQDLHVFSYKTDSTDIDDEISAISLKYRNSKVVVIIDDYYKHFDILKRFREYGLKNIVFLLTSRMSRNTVNYRKLISVLDINENDIQPLFLDKIKEPEAKDIAEIFIQNNILPSRIQSNEIPDIVEYLLKFCHGQFSNIVLDCFESSYIKQQLVDLFEKCVEDDSSSIKEIAIAALASATMNFGITLTEILSLLNIDYIALQMRESLVINELFNIEDDDLKIKSSIISRKILNDIISPNDLFNVLKKIVFAADRISSVNSRNKEILKAMISHSNFIQYTKKENDIVSVKKFYNDIRNIDFCKKSPFFWEQFASSCIDAKDFDTAKQCIENAFLHAGNIHGFVPFQVETVYAHCILAKAKEDLLQITIEADQIIAIIEKAYDFLLRHYDHLENNHYYIFKVWDIAVDIILENIEKLNRRESSSILEKIINMKRKFITYKSSSELSFHHQITSWEAKQENCIAKIKGRM